MLTNECSHAKESPLRIAIITALQGGRPGLDEHLRRFPEVLGPRSRYMAVISGWTLIEKDHIARIREKIRGRKRSLLRTTLWYVPRYELGTAVTLARAIRNVDIVIYFLSPPLILPTLLTRLFGKRTVFVITGVGSKELKRKLTNGVARYLLSGAYAILEYACFNFVDVVAAESEYVLHAHGLLKFRRKFIVFGAKPVDTTLFRITVPWAQREDLVGFVGRLSPEKGILNLVEAIPGVLGSCPDLRFVIIGDGVLRKEFEKRVRERSLEHRVTLTGWVPHEKIPEWLNRLRLVASPSYTEGLPPLVQEAMACGTPVLATGVGGVPDLIRDGKTGFLLEDNSPECIARRVIEVLNDPRLPEVSERASAFIQEHYSRERVTEQWREVLEELVKR